MTKQDDIFAKYPMAIEKLKEKGIAMSDENVVTSAAEETAPVEEVKHVLIQHRHTKKTFHGLDGRGNQLWVGYCSNGKNFGTEEAADQFRKDEFDAETIALTKIVTVGEMGFGPEEEATA